MLGPSGAKVLKTNGLFVSNGFLRYFARMLAHAVLNSDGNVLPYLSDVFKAQLCGMYNEDECDFLSADFPDVSDNDFALQTAVAKVELIY